MVSGVNLSSQSELITVRHSAFKLSAATTSRRRAASKLSATIILAQPLQATSLDFPRNYPDSD